MSASRERTGAAAPDEPVQTGRILKWTDERGFGFIQPEAGGDTVFVHISAFVNSPRRPKEGDVVYYQVDREQRRTKAVNVRIKALPLPDTVTVAYGVGVLWMTVYVLFLFGFLELWMPVLAYLLMSIITFGFYFVDKKRAEQTRWRITGTTLHVLEGLGGWPGALLAMSMLRHLTRKRDHLAMLCAIIAIHLSVWIVWYIYS